jgi:sortase A
MWNGRKSERGQVGSPGAGQSPEPKRTVWLWTERLLFAAGLVLLVVYSVCRFESILKSRAALRKFAAANAAGSASIRSAGEDLISPLELDPPKVDFSQWDEQRVEAYKESLAKRFGPPLGVLRISKIHLEVPILDGTDDLTLNHAVGRIAGTTRPGERGNIGIAGHRDGFFRGLKDVVVGDVIELKTLKGTDTYVVDQIQIVAPADVEVLQPRPAPSLMLVTSYPFYFAGSAPQRYVVTASLTREAIGGWGMQNPASDPQ